MTSHAVRMCIEKREGDQYRLRTTSRNPRPRDFCLDDVGSWFAIPELIAVPSRLLVDDGRVGRARNTRETFLSEILRELRVRKVPAFAFL